MIKVSIIVPVYNVEKYLKKCLKSLVEQTLDDIEILVVNDESPDNSQMIIDQFVEAYPEKVKTFVKKNGGQGSARNLALKFAKGKYIGFVDSDDWVDKAMYEKMYNKAEKEKLDVVICDMRDHYPDYTVFLDCTNYKIPYEKTPSACNKLFKKEIIKNIYFPENKLWYEDFDFTTKILLKEPKIGVIHKDFYHCHCREVSTMNNNNSLKNLDILCILDDIIKYAKENRIYDKYKDILDYLIIYHVLLTTINRVCIQKNKDKKIVLKKLVAYCRKHVKNYRENKYYKQLNKNKRIIIFLNYIGLYHVSRQILTINSKIKK